MKVFYFLCIVSLHMLIAACSTTPYQEKHNQTPLGYSDHKIEHHRYRVVYESYEDEASFVDVKGLALYRAAELTHQLGQPYFIVEKKSNESIEDVKLIPEYSRTITFHSTDDAGLDKSYEAEVNIPGYFLTFNVKKVSLTIALTDQESEKTYKAEELLNQPPI